MLQLLEVNSLFATDYNPEESDEYFLAVINEAKSNNVYSTRTDTNYGRGYWRHYDKRV